MNKEQLEIAKRIAEIEGIETINYSRFIYKECSEGLLFVNGKSYACYNPFNWSILGLLMVKYDVAIDYANETVDIFSEENDEYMYWESFNGKEDIPRAILKCIIASQRKIK